MGVGAGRSIRRCPVSRKMSNLTHLVGRHVGGRSVRQERETSSPVKQVQGAVVNIRPDGGLNITPFGGHTPPEWYRQYRAWSRMNITFGSQSGVLWVGTPEGALIEIDLDRQQAVRHDLLQDSRVTALCATAAGDLVIATGEGDLVLAAVRTESASADTADVLTAQALAAAFVNSTTEAPDDGILEDYLAVTDGTQTWEPDVLEAVTSATERDPTWLQHRAAINRLFSQESK
jgi:hypothetical protein